MKYLFFLLSLLLAFNVHAQDVKVIKLKQEPITHNPSHFHIISVVDDRTDTANIGTIKTGLRGKQVALTLQDGVATAVTRFIKNNVAQNQGTTPVSMHITDLKITKKTEILKDRVDASLSLEFYVNDKKVIEYTCTAYQEVSMDAAFYIEQLIRRTLDYGITQFDKWWAANKDVYTVKPLKVNVIMAKKATDPDNITYTPSRLLSYDDFQGRPDEVSRGIAATYSGIYMKYASQTTNGQTVVNVTIDPCFLKTKSWCKKAGHNAYALAHEQVHFDITAVKACELEKNIFAFPLTNENYADVLESLRKQNQKEWEEMETAYDDETKHGTIIANQKKWAEKVAQLLANQGCY